MGAWGVGAGTAGLAFEERRVEVEGGEACGSEPLAARVRVDVERVDFDDLGGFGVVTSKI